VQRHVVRPARSGWPWRHAPTRLTRLPRATARENRCGPCKMFKPAYEQFATAYEKQAVFTTIMGDANDDCKLLMTRMNVKSVPAFFFYRGGKEVSAFTGANKTGASSGQRGRSKPLLCSPHCFAWRADAPLHSLPQPARRSRHHAMSAHARGIGPAPAWAPALFNTFVARERL
jgi:thiol-disulfide isomerase/thioredoxin